MINHVHVPDVYKVNRLCVKPKQIVQQTDILIAWNQMDYLVIMKINAFIPLISHPGHILLNTHIMLSQIMAGYQIIRPNAINKQRYLKYVGG